MRFCNIRDRLKQYFDTEMANKDHLFSVNIDGDKLYQTYLESFKNEDNPMFRERTVHDCSECRAFIKKFGNVVAIHENQIQTIWDFMPDDPIYNHVIGTMRDSVLTKKIKSVFLSESKKVGVKENYELDENGTSHKWEHFYVDLPDKFVKKKQDIPSALAEKNSKIEVFGRSLREISKYALGIIIELSTSNTLYKGAEYLSALTKFKNLKDRFDALTTDAAKELFIWENGVNLHESVAKIKNTAIGTLLIDLSNERPLEEAITTYEKITAPANYKRSKPIFTQKMLDDAKKTIAENGYESALNRRFAVANDISVSDVLFVNRDIKPKLKNNNPLSMLDSIAKSEINPEKFSKVQEVTPDEFIKNILPNANDIQVLFENNHRKNLVSITAPADNTAKPLFKWGNGFSHVYNGNVTDSMKELIAKKGGNINGDLRFSIMWNQSGEDNVDLDAHCRIWSGNPDRHIYYFDKYDRTTKGQLDVDIQNPMGEIAVENIVFPNKELLKDKTVMFHVHQYAGDLKHGFSAEIEFDGEIHKFEYPHILKRGEVINIAKVSLKNDKLVIEPLLKSEKQSITEWGIKTNNFIPVNMICFSPNYWENNSIKTGHKHLLFMLKGCINPENQSGIFNEYLTDELYAHRKVFEALAINAKCPDEPNQLSGLGFALDKRESITVKVKGATERVVKIKF